jgi:hypothetical protein
MKRHICLASSIDPPRHRPSSSAVFRVPGTSEPLADCLLHSTLLHPDNHYSKARTKDDEEDSEITLHRYTKRVTLPNPRIGRRNTFLLLKEVTRDAAMKPPLSRPLTGFFLLVRAGFCVCRCERGTSEQLPDAKDRYHPVRSEACSREKRNKWEGPTKWEADRLCRLRT